MKKPYQNRPLEFRAWHIENEQLFNVFGFSDDVVIEQDTFYSWPLNECILMQSTGEIDPNGVKVWEGDVLRFDIDISEDPDPFDDEFSYSSYSYVVWHRSAFCLIHVGESKLDDKKDPEPYQLLFNNTNLVVGNRYQYPHLMDLVGLQPLATKQSEHETANT